MEQGETTMDSLATGMKNVRKMFDENQIMEYGDVYANKPTAYKAAKRIFDIAMSLVALVVLSPVFLATAAAIWLEDGGPVFFVQPRAGKDLKPFRMYKFRSMFKDADKMFAALQEQNEQSGHAFKIKDDPRITKVGRFIRKYSIDELPQLINILKGDMSIVGPRPILTFQMETCNEYQKQRLAVKPGLTCYWQIGGRADIQWEDWVELDLKYITDMSMGTDLSIIWKTIPVVLKGDGAY